jgi:hypothetical protein
LNTNKVRWRRVSCFADCALLAAVQEERVTAARAKLQRQVASSSGNKVVPPTAGLPVYGPPTKAAHDVAELKAVQRLLGAAVEAGPEHSDSAATCAAIKLFSLVSSHSEEIA